MELDSLKDLWKEADKKETAPVANDAIASMLNKPSQSPIAKMKRNVMIELIALLVLFPAVSVFYFVAFKGTYSAISWMYILLMGVSLLYYYKKWTLLKNMQCVACRVKSNLEMQVKVLEKYVKLYLWMGTGIMPLVIVFLGILFHYKFPATHGWFFPSFSGQLTTSFILWLALLASFTAVIFIINRWYVRRLYGRHIQQLNRILQQMEE